MRNKVSNSLFKRGLISFAAAGLLASSVYGAGSYIPQLLTDREKYNIHQLMSITLIDGDSNSSNQNVKITSSGTLFNVTKVLSTYGSASGNVAYLGASSSSSFTTGNDGNGTIFTTDSTANANGAADTNASLYVNLPDTVTLSFTATDGDSVTKSIPIDFATGSFNGSTTKVYAKTLAAQDKNVTIVLLDNDLNLATDVNNSKKIKVSNNSGVSVNMILDETGPNTGLFKGILHVGTDTNLSNQVISYGGTLNATTYIDSNSSVSNNEWNSTHPQFDRGTTISVSGSGDTLKVTYGTNVNAGTLASVSNSDAEGNVSGYTMDIQTGGQQSNLTHQIEVSAGTKGTLELSSTSLTAGTPLTITLTDADLNTNSASVQQTDNNTSNMGIASSSTVNTGFVGIYITDSNGSYDYNVSTRLIETGLNTGVFSKTISFYAATGMGTTTAIDYNGSSIPVAQGSTITVKYNDALDGTASTTDNIISASSSFTTHDGSLEVSSNSVNNGAQIKLTLTEADLNTDATTIQTFESNATESNVTICLSGSTSSSTTNGVYCLGQGAYSLTFTETGINTGIFTSEVFEVNTTGNGTPASANTVAPYDLNLTGTTKIATAYYYDYVNASGGMGSSASPTSTASFVGTTSVAFLSIDASTYSVGATVNVTLNDADLNTDANAVDTYTTTTSPVKIDNTDGSTDIASSGIAVKLTETGANTGIFTGAIILTDSSSENASLQKLGVTTGNTITVIYDEGRNGTFTTSDSTNSVTDKYATAKITSTTAVLEIAETKVNTLGDRINITVTDPDLNLNSGTKESATATVKSTTSAAGMSVTLTETGINTGVFSGYAETTLSTSATSTTPYINVQSGDTIAVVYTDSKNTAGSQEVMSKALVAEQTEATIDVASTVEANSKLTITITEPDGGYSSTTLLGTTSIAKDSIPVRVYSSASDGIGFDITLVETESNSKVFTGSIDITDSASVSGARLQAKEGETVTIRYNDYTHGTATGTTVSASQLKKVEAQVTVGQSVNLVASDTEPSVAIGGTVDVGFTGMNDSLTVTEGNSSIATATVNADIVTITGVAEGNTTISVTDGSDTVVLNVTVTTEPTVETFKTAEVVSGWNLLGNASGKAIDSTTIENADAVWTYDSANNKWSSKADDSVAIPNGAGFWYQTTVANATGLEFEMGSDSTTPSFTAGTWTLLANGAENKISTIKDNHDSATMVYTYKGGAWYNSTDNADEMVETGRGYWVK